MPVSKALIAVLVLFAAVSQWNSWFNAMIYLTKEEQMPLQMVLRDLIVNQSALSIASESASMGGECFYPFVQKYFVKGVMIGSVKG